MLFAFTSPLLNRYLTQFGSPLCPASSSPMNLFHPPTSGSEYVGSHEEDEKGLIIRPATACIFSRRASVSNNGDCSCHP
jgi:hypothetical protein